MKEEVIWIGLTGGPCSGKTSILSFLSRKIADYGWDVYTRREAATLLMEMGVKLSEAIEDGDPCKIEGYQGIVMQVTRDLERHISTAAALEERRAVVFCDRPIPDGRAYLPEGLAGDLAYERLLGMCGTEAHTALEVYKGIIKVTTAADGAPEFYTLANNATRKETPEQAIYRDRRIEEAYLGHPHFRVVDNSTDFEGKKLRVLREVCHLLGIPIPLEIERKYRVTIPDVARFPVTCRTVFIEQTYLTPPDAQEEVRVRRRSVGGGSTYYLTRKIFLESGKRSEVEEQIPQRTYEDLIGGRDPDIRKERTCFLWRSQYFELDIFNHPIKNWALLEIELTDLHDHVSLPPFIDVIDEVTDDPAYSNRHLAITK